MYTDSYEDLGSLFLIRIIFYVLHRCFMSDLHLAKIDLQIIVSDQIKTWIEKWLVSKSSIMLDLK